MFRTNLLIAWRHLMANKIYSITNIGGLAIGLSAFIMVLLYETHLSNYDAWDSGFKNVYMIRLHEHAKDKYSEEFSPFLVPLVQAQCPEVEASTRVTGSGNSDLLRVGDKKLYQDNIVNVDSTFFKVYPLRLKAGDVRTALNGPYNMVISTEVAEKFFGSKNPIGQVIRFDESRDYVVTGVLEPLNGPTNIPISVLKRIHVPGWAGWGNLAYQNFVKLKPGTNLQQLSDKLTRIYFNATYDDMKQWYGWPNNKDEYLKRPGHDAMEVTNIAHLSLEHAKQQLFELSLLCAVILIVACINFTNQSIANADSRAKEIGVRKVLGGLRGSLTRQFLTETFLQCLAALLVSLILVELLLPAFNKLTDQHISLLAYCTHADFLGKILLTLLGVVLLAGLYPAFYLSAFKPALVLKGIFDRGTGGMLLRKLLLSLQFICSIAFVIALVIISRQTAYMQHYDLGFTPDDVIYIRMKENTTPRNFEYVQQQLRSIPHVQQVGFTDYAPFINNTGNYNVFAFRNTEKDIRQICITRNYFASLGAKIIEGRDFAVDRPDSTQSIIVNEALVKAYNIPEPVVGQYLRDTYTDPHAPAPVQAREYQIVGVVKDFMLEGFDTPIEPVAFMNKPSSTVTVLVKTDPHYNNETIRKITELWKNIEPAHPIVLANISTDLEKATATTTRLQKVVYLFAGVTILIALIGLLALVAYNLKRRMKEIGIRKVVGASLRDVLQMLNKEFLLLLAIANAVAWVIAYLFMTNFLKNFAYRISMPYLVFPVITVCSVVLTICIVSARVWKAIRTTPAEVLKYE